MLPMSDSPRLLRCFSLVCGLALVLVACDDDGGDRKERDTTPDTLSDATGDLADTEADQVTPDPQDLVYVFSAEAATNTWQVTVLVPGQPEAVVRAFPVEELALLSGPAGNDAGPGWGDAVVSPDGSRVFVNATSVDRVAVFETETHTLEALLEVGSRPVHAYNPNHNNELWVHADGEGAFYVIDMTTLAVSEPVVAALANTGHGKLLYTESLGSKYYATNTNDPGAFVIDGEGRTDGTLIPLCARPCDDDPSQTCGATHDKAFNPALGQAIFQCSGATGGHFAFVDAATDTVVDDLVPLTGGLAYTDDYSHIAVVDGAAGRVGFWLTDDPSHDGRDFDLTVDIASPSDRGVLFRDNGSNWEAWVPQIEGHHVVVIALNSGARAELEIGTQSAPGGGHPARRAVFAGHWFVTHADSGIVAIDATTSTAAEPVPIFGIASRLIALPSP